MYFSLLGKQVWGNRNVIYYIFESFYEKFLSVKDNLICIGQLRVYERIQISVLYDITSIKNDYFLHLIKFLFSKRLISFEDF